MEVENMHENYKIEDDFKSALKGFTTSLEKSINDIIDEEGYITYNIHKQTISTNGGNYLGVLYEVDLKGNTKDGEKETNIFVKSINSGENMTLLSITDVYRTELFAYRELSKIFAELQDDANVPVLERYKMVKSYENSSTEAIILENMSRKGFKTYHRMEIVPLKFAEMSIKELAKLHVLSFVLQEKRPDYFDKKIKELKHPFNFGNDWQGFVKSMFNLTMKYVDDDVKDKVENTYYKITDKYIKYLEDEKIRVCLCHGDYRPNNIMIKMNNGEVIDIIPVDYQLLCYSCPVFDFIYFIFSCTDRKFRKAHLSHLKDLYHDTMRTFLEYFNMDVDSVYPRRMFEEVYREKLDYGLLFGYLFLPFMLASEDDVPDITKELSGINFKVNDAYKKRLRGIIDDFIEWGYV